MAESNESMLAKMMGKLRYSILVVLKAHFQIPNQFKNECVHKIKIWIWTFSLVFFKALTFSLQVTVSVKINVIFRKNRSSRATLLKKDLWHRYFPVNFAKFLKTLLQNTTGGRFWKNIFRLASFFSNSSQKTSWLSHDLLSKAGNFLLHLDSNFLIFVLSGGHVFS